MRRLFWLAMGVTIGVLVVRKVSRAAEKMTPKGLATSLADALNNLADAIGTFAADVRDAMQEREAELRAGTGFDGHLGRTEENPPPTQGQSTS
jgi:hypothetical protein